MLAYFSSVTQTSGLNQPVIGLITVGGGVAELVKYPVVPLSTFLMVLIKVHRRKKEVRNADLIMKENYRMFIRSE